MVDRYQDNMSFYSLVQLELRTVRSCQAAAALELPLADRSAGSFPRSVLDSSRRLCQGTAQASSFLGQEQQRIAMAAG